MAMPINLLIISTLALHVPSTRGEREHGNEDNTNALSLELLSQGACGEPSCVEWCDDLPFPGKGTEIKFFYAEWCPCAQQIFALLKGLNKLEAWFLSRVLVNWLMAGGTFKRLLRIAFCLWIRT